MARLDQICKLNMGQSPDSTSYNENGNGMPFFQGNADFGMLHPTVRVWCSDPTKVANPGDILISVRAPIGALNVADVKCCIGRGLAALTVDESKCTKEYLWHAIRSKVSELNSKGTGSTFKAISKNTLAETEIPLPTLDDQRHISASMDKCDHLISLRREQLAKLDELVKARFVELFGDPRTNSKGFKTKKGVDLFKISNGKAVPNDKRFESGIPAYGGNGISWYTDDVLYEQDTIVIGRVGFQSGNVHLVKGPVWITDNAMYISEFYDDSLSLVFLCEMMEQIDFTKHQDAGDLKKVTQKPFMEMEYILPPKNLQSDYIAFVEQTDKSKLAIRQSLDKLETLKKSLMQEYFG